MFGVQREDRFVEASCDKLGPGSYQSEKYGSIERQKPIAGGFGRGDRPVPFEGSAAGAGPGSYDLGSSLAESTQSHVAFKSRTQRQVGEKGTETPGPGSYLQQHSLESSEKKTRSKQQQQQQWSWERVPTAPSIPTRKERFGYDEGPSGELILQEEANRGYDGVVESAAGPADYEPRIEYTKKGTRAVDFGKGGGHQFATERVKSLLELEDERLRALPPGAQYCHESSAFGGRTATKDPVTKDGKPRKSAVFSSTVERTKDVPAEASPGPGSYECRNEEQQQPKEQKHHFGSTAPRFVDRAARRCDPGPGTYTIVSEWRPRRSRGRRKRGDEILGFDSTETRFRASRSRDQHESGPGSSFFASASKRDLLPGAPTKTSLGSSAAAAAPPPGAYEVGVDWTKNVKGVAKLSSGTSTKDRTPTTNSVGPGSYDIPPTIRVAMPRKQLTTAPRFPEASSEDEGPGPGAYDYQLPYGNMLKPTYNVAIAAECRDLFF
ncbi:hypothetical protein CTAYLR_008786 [Chrysophaeum taylorii]|uniref:Sperm-tail PG-rich repeat-containing protein 2 n=1 Tax=Chrysophaeum taylorii TaxID=2483200 RepID=A0AAD7UQD6_9STRA|nr:hypothetical protein CTAYLR_008786 [Chrysophaeum taylorii]